MFIKWAKKAQTVKSLTGLYHSGFKWLQEQADCQAELQARENSSVKL